MPTIIRPDLATADGAEVTDALLDAGYRIIRTMLESDGLHIEVEDAPTPAAITAALAGFASTAPRGSYESALPARWREHLAHLRAYRDAVRAGTPPTNAESQHALADLIDLMARLLPTIDAP